MLNDYILDPHPLPTASQFKGGMINKIPQQVSQGKNVADKTSSVQLKYLCVRVLLFLSHLFEWLSLSIEDTRNSTASSLLAVIFRLTSSSHHNLLQKYRSQFGAGDIISQHKSLLGVWPGAFKHFWPQSHVKKKILICSLAN